MLIAKLVSEKSYRQLELPFEENISAPPEKTIFVSAADEYFERTHYVHNGRIVRLPYVD